MLDNWEFKAEKEAFEKKEAAFVAVEDSLKRELKQITEQRDSLRNAIEGAISRSRLSIVGVGELRAALETRSDGSRVTESSGAALETSCHHPPESIPGKPKKMMIYIAEAPR
ncbi:hypothetical protein CYMTET_37665 [Cymbomonas tetramitiformis]|uniref:Uncharacterized protein n=1 Tax=Cymbomonas tetramitiformis TaxID=36881 RepID=A0AAE0CF29_9CHLO|nr:hypothetical protein CYMTET_37665 [Cymbomonas tetramitiformis]